MARTEQRLKEAMEGDAGVVALVETRIFMGFPDQGAAFPHIIYKRIGGAPLSSLGGDSGLDNGIFSVECVSEDSDEAGDVADAVVAALDTLAARLLLKTHVRIRRTLWDDVREAWRVVMDISAWKQED